MKHVWPICTALLLCGCAPPGSCKDQTACLVLDADMDGGDDFVIAERNEAPAVVLYRSSATGWGQYIVDAGHVRTGAGGAVADIASIGWTHNRVLLYENQTVE